MSVNILATKIHVPSASNDLVPRPLLTDRINDGIGRKLTLISAPAGFGKTSLLAQWRSTPPGSDLPAAWVSLDEDDNDPARFFTYVIAALQTVHPKIGATALVLIDSREPPSFESIITTLINDHALITEDYCLVLDDYHLIEAEPIHSAITFLLEHLPEHMHLVIGSRTDPPFSLARMRGRGELAELRSSDLQFTKDEIAAFFAQVMGLNLSQEDVTSLESRTEGWIAGLRLAGLSMQGREDLPAFIETFSGTHRYLLDYLGEEVLQRQPEDVQDFLEKTSILARLTGPLCDAVTGQSDGQETLKEFERANLFTTALDDERLWYRYHHLFAGFLVRRLSQREDSRVSDLHSQASAWYEANDQPHEAIGHALTAADYDTAGRLIEQAGNTEGAEGRSARTFLGWLDALPEEQIRARPKLGIHYSVALFNTLQFHKAEPHLQVVEAAISGMADSSAESRELLGQVAVQRSVLTRLPRGDTQDLPLSIEWAKKALELLLPESTWRMEATLNLGESHLENFDPVAAETVFREALSIGEKIVGVNAILKATNNLARVEKFRGKFKQAHQTIQQGLQLAAERGEEKLPALAGLHETMGEILGEWNELDAATDHLNSSIELGKEYGDDAILIHAYADLTFVKHIQGDPDAASDLFDRVIQILEKANLTTAIASIFEPFRVQLWLLQGRLEEAGRWAEGSGLSADDVLSQVRIPEYHALTLVYIAQRKLDEAMRLLEAIQVIAERSGAGGVAHVGLLVLQAVIFDAKGDMSQAEKILERAIALAEPEDMIRSFEPIAAMLPKILKDHEQGRGPDSHEISQGYLRKLVEAFTEVPVHDASTALERAQQQLTEPLTNRELEVIRLIAAGMSNRGIAEELIVTVGTVKAHAHNIYGKLEVGSRAQAIARTRELNLLE